MSRTPSSRCSRRCAPEPQAQSLELQPLSELASATLVRAALGDEAADAFCRSCHEASGGNPFLLGELVATVADEQLPPSAETVIRVSELGPAAVSRSVLRRLSRLPPGATRLAQAVAVLDAGATLAQAGTLAGLDPACALQAAVALPQARLIGPGEPIGFTHPVLRAAVYQDLPHAHQLTLHSQAARLARRARHHRRPGGRAPAIRTTDW